MKTDSGSRTPAAPAVVLALAMALVPISAAPAAAAAVVCPASLQAAIDAAGAGDTIDIAAGTCVENIAIGKNLTLRGAGAAATLIDGGLSGTVVTISGGAVVELAGLTIRRGSATAGDANGGGVLLTGASSVTLRDSVVADNSAAGAGGGIYSQEGGTVTLINSTVTGNTAGSNGGGIFSTGTGNSVVIVDSTISGNKATLIHGGGLYITDGAASVTRSTLSGNDAGDDGGAIYAVGGGTTTLNNVTISGNRASVNAAATGFGGAIFLRDPMLVSTHATITGNSAFRGGGLFVGGLGLGSATFGATILSGNSATSQTAPGPDCVRLAGAGPVSTAGYNLFGSAAAADCGFTAAGSDLVGVDPRLGPLADNGGPRTHALLLGSPALNVVTAGCPPPATDARKIARPQGSACDIGAFELEPPPPSATVGLVDPTSGRWYLRSVWETVTFLFYGNPDDIPFMGDWDCDGVDTPGLFRQSDAFAYLRNSNSQGNADIRFFFGNPDDVPIAGDFNGDGCDTLSLYRPSEQRFYIINKLGQNEGGLGEADFSFVFGNPGDKPVAGDWDADGVTEVGLHRESTGFFYYRNTLDTGIASDEFFFGDPGDRFVAGDWGIVDGQDSPAVFRPSTLTFYFKHQLVQGNADSQFPWPGSASGWLPVAGWFGV
jgi:predicted outer membrane repeat protein